MATRGTFRASEANPFRWIAFRPEDRSAPEGGGGGPKELVPVTSQYRASLNASLTAASAALLPEIQAHPSTPGVLILKLRDIAVAKTHRPNTLVAEAGLQPAGVGRIDEMLVAANAASILNFSQTILHRQTQAIKANLSAIQRIDAWDSQRRMEVPADQLRAHGSILLTLFRYHATDATARNLDVLRLLMQHRNIHAEVIPQRWGPPVFRIDAQGLSEESFTALTKFPGLRAIFREPIAFPSATSGATLAGPLPAPIPEANHPIVGVFDTGTAANALSLRPWIAGTDTYVLAIDTDYVHGTAVASLVAGGRLLNNDHALISPTRCMVHDVCAMESGFAKTADLVLRLGRAMALAPQVKVWNLSLGSAPISSDEFSWFAQQLDALSDQHGVLCVIAAGNYEGTPRRGWPATALLDDRLSSPGDSVRSLTVGSVAHLDGPGALVNAGQPASYSRRGPGPVFTPKPDLVHAGGGVHAPWAAGLTSMQVLQPDNTVGSGFGTSYAAPLVTGLAAHVWQSLDGQPNFTVKPHMVKALMIHAARLASPDYGAAERRYFGAGVPSDALATLYDRDDCFTLMFEVMVVPGYKWRKTPYPIPDVLMRNGRLQAEVIITAVYSPPLDPNSGAEYVRANANVSFGVLNGNRISGKVPLEGETGTTGYEATQIEFGGKWSPVKLHRKSFPVGVAGAQWAIQVEALLRANEPPLAEPLNVALLVSLRALDGNGGVNGSGIRALNNANWLHQTLPTRVPVTV